MKQPASRLIEDLTLFAAGIGAMAFLTIMLAVDVGRVLWCWCTGGRCR